MGETAPDNPGGASIVLRPGVPLRPEAGCVRESFTDGGGCVGNAGRLRRAWFEAGLPACVRGLGPLGRPAITRKKREK